MTDERGNAGAGAQPVLNRIRSLPQCAVRNMVCHPHRLDFKAILDEGKIFWPAQQRRDAQRQANRAMLITDFQMAADPARRRERDIQPFYLFVEEVSSS